MATFYKSENNNGYNDETAEFAASVYKRLILKKRSD